jgi:hypothetical protein
MERLAFSSLFFVKKNEMRRRRRRHDDGSADRISSSALRVATFVAAFCVGHFHARYSNLNSVPFDKHDVMEKGWHTIHVFYGSSPERSSPEWHSQVGQDELVASLFPHGKYFVDLAANDAIHWSNTYALEQKLEWTGLLIEPTPFYWHDLAVLRTSKVVAACVGNSTLEKVSWKRGKEVSGIVGFDNPNKPGRMFPTKFTVSLLDLFQHENVPHVIDYLSLDVEGAEEFILTKFPLEQYKISILTVERPSSTLMEFLQRHGFRLLATLSDWGETIWAHDSVVLKNTTLLKQYEQKIPPWNPDTKQRPRREQ